MQHILKVPWIIYHMFHSFFRRIFVAALHIQLHYTTVSKKRMLRASASSSSPISYRTFDKRKQEHKLFTFMTLAVQSNGKNFLLFIKSLF